MTNSRARAWFAGTAAAVAIGLLVQVPVAATNSASAFSSPWARGLNVFAFFTIQSNLLVGGTSLALALNPLRHSTTFATLRLRSLTAITITGVVYHVALAHLLELDSWALVADQVLHTVVPVAAVAGWLAFGPRGLTSKKLVVLATIFPVVWMVFTLVRGALSRWYPYPFINVAHLGYGKALLNCLWVAILYVGVASGATSIDAFLGRRNQGDHLA